LADIAPRYLRHLEAKGRKRSTIVAATSCLEVWLLPALGDRTLDAIRGEHVEDLMVRMEAGDRPGRGGEAVEAVRDEDDSQLRRHPQRDHHFATHSRRRWATANPCDDVDLPELEGYEDIRFLEPVEVQALASAAFDGPYQSVDGAFYVTAAMTGLRHGELIALRWRDVDWTAMRVRVRQNYVLGEYGTPKSRRSTRSVPMAREVGGALDRLYQGSRWQGDDDLVFAEPAHWRAAQQGGEQPPLPQGARRGEARRHAPHSRPAAHVRHHVRRRRRADADAAGVDGPPGHRDDAAVRRLRAEHPRGRADRGGVRLERGRHRAQHRSDAWLGRIGDVPQRLLRFPTQGAERCHVGHVVGLPGRDLPLV